MDKFLSFSFTDKRYPIYLSFQVREDLLQNLRFLHPTVPSATIFPESIDELKHCRQASGTPQTIYFLKADDVSYPNLDENTNTKTNTETNTKTETNKGKTNDSYDVIYF